jgi:hypothetical protein
MSLRTGKANAAGLRTFFRLISSRTTGLLAIIGLIAVAIGNIKDISRCIADGLQCFYQQETDSPTPILTDLSAISGSAPSAIGLFETDGTYSITLSYAGTDQLFVDEIRTATWIHSKRFHAANYIPSVFLDEPGYRVFYPNFTGEARFKLGCPIRLGGTDSKSVRLVLNTFSPQVDEALAYQHASRLVFRNATGRTGMIPVAAALEPDNVGLPLTTTLLWPSETKDLDFRSKRTPHTDVEEDPVTYLRSHSLRTESGAIVGMWSDKTAPIALSDYIAECDSQELPIIARASVGSKALGAVGKRIERMSESGFDVCDYNDRYHYDYDRCRSYFFAAQALYGNQSTSTRTKSMLEEYALRDNVSGTMLGAVASAKGTSERVWRKALFSIYAGGSACRDKQEKYCEKRLQAGFLLGALANNRSINIDLSRYLVRTNSPLLIPFIEKINPQDRVVLSQLSTHASCEVRSAVASIKYIASDVLSSIDSSACPKVAELIARMEERSRRELNSDEPESEEGVPDEDPIAVERAIETDPIAVASAAGTNQDILQRLSQSTDVAVRIAVASNKATPYMALQRLANDDNPHVRLSAYSNPDLARSNEPLLVKYIQEFDLSNPQGQKMYKNLMSSWLSLATERSEHSAPGENYHYQVVTLRISDCR